MIYQGKSCKVEMVQASVCAITKTPIYTLILEYPRIIHSQLLTHRVFTKNSSSTRAMPIKKVIKQIEENPAKPIWTLNQKGMQGELLTNPERLQLAEEIRKAMFKTVSLFVDLLAKPEEENGLNIHKQNAGRYLEPFQNIRVCLTSTEWENWDWLRVDADAQPEIVELANLMKQAREKAEPLEIYPGQWHVPFVKRVKDEHSEISYFTMDDKPVELDQALQISMSCAAQTSYRNLDTSLEKAEDMYDKLFAGKKVHASPSEHQATPIGDDVFEDFPETDVPNHLWKQGITHMDRYQQFWSGNFRNWIQHRQLIPNHDPTKA